MNKYFVDDFKVGDRIIASGNRLGMVSDITKKITVTWQNGLSAEYTPKQMQAWNYKKLSEEKEAIAPCQDSHNLTSAQELEPVFVTQDSSTDLNLSEPQRLTITAQASSNCDIPAYTTTETCEISQDLPNKDLDIICIQEESISSQLPHPAPRSPQKANDLEQQTRETVSPQFLNPSKSCSQNSQQLKTSPVCSLVPIAQEMSAVTSGMFLSSFPSAGMMRTGLLSEVDTVPLPSLESGYCWLPSPGALSSIGKGRPPGQTKQEGGLKDLGLLQKGEVLNPDILCEWYGLPQNWLDPLECRAAVELLENNERQQEIFSILESQRSPYKESSTSTPYVENQQPVTRANAKLSGGCGMYGLTPANFLEEKMLSVNIERTQQLQIGVRVRITKTRTQNLSQWIGHEAEVTGINGETISVAAGEGREKKHLTLKKGWYEVIPENFLEETEPQQEAVQKPKGRQCKGCLYKYIENKKLKNGTIASYPRVIGHREPDNPTHWRWGFNWEEKIDGEWKGRSIGSIPVGAMALIQSMQNEGVPLEEIIGFIKRAKNKKS